MTEANWTVCDKCGLRHTVRPDGCPRCGGAGTGAPSWDGPNVQHEETGGGGGGFASGVPGWVWFILIFGVGNLILYSTTGIYLIPIPRR